MERIDTDQDVFSKEDSEKVARIIYECNALLLTSGAGLGVDSGLPDFRGFQEMCRYLPV